MVSSVSSHSSVTIYNKVLPVPPKKIPPQGCWDGLKHSFSLCCISEDVKKKMLWISQRNLFYCKPCYPTVYFARWGAKRTYNGWDDGRRIVFMIHIPSAFTPAFKITSPTDPLKERVYQYCLVAAEFLNACVLNRKHDGLLPEELNLDACLVDDDGQRKSYSSVLGFMCNQGFDVAVDNLLKKGVDVSGAKSLGLDHCSPIEHAGDLEPKVRFKIISTLLQHDHGKSIKLKELGDTLNDIFKANSESIKLKDLADDLNHILKANSDRYHPLVYQRAPLAHATIASLDPYFVSLLRKFIEHGLEIDANMSVIRGEPNKRILQISCEGSDSDTGLNMDSWIDNKWLIIYLVLKGAECEIDPHLLLTTEFFCSRFGMLQHVAAWLSEAIQIRNKILLDIFTHEEWPFKFDPSKERQKIAQRIAHELTPWWLAEKPNSFVTATQIIKTIKDINRLLEENADLSEILIAKTIGEYATEMTKKFNEPTSVELEQIKSIVRAIKDKVNLLFVVRNELELVKLGIGKGDAKSLYAEEKALINYINLSWNILQGLPLFKEKWGSFPDPKLNLETQNKTIGELERGKVRNFEKLEKEILSNWPLCRYLLENLLENSDINAKIQDINNLVYEVAKQNLSQFLKKWITDTFYRRSQHIFMYTNLRFAEISEKFRGHIEKSLEQRPLSGIASHIVDYMGTEPQNFWDIVFAQSNYLKPRQ